MSPFYRNVGTADRTLRIGIGLLLIGLTAAGTIGVWGMVGLLPVLTGMAGYCPAYKLFGLNTCSSRRT